MSADYNTSRYGESDNAKARRLEEELELLLDYLGINRNDWNLAKDAPNRVNRALFFSKGIHHARPKGRG
jgi:hypothetical protein